jgi:hypothetical protein
MLLIRGTKKAGNQAVSLCMPPLWSCQVLFVLSMRLICWKVDARILRTAISGERKRSPCRKSSVENIKNVPQPVPQKVIAAKEVVSLQYWSIEQQRLPCPVKLQELNT